MRIRFVLLTAALLISAAPATAQCLGPSCGIGGPGGGIWFTPYAGYNFDAEEFVVGVGLHAGLPIGPPLVLNPAIETLLGGTGTQLQADLNALYYITGMLPLAVYVGAGLAVAYFSYNSISNTELAFNLLAGARLRNPGFVKPFAQFRYTNFFDGGNGFTGMVGIALPIGG